MKPCVTKWMRLTPRGGKPEPEREIGGFREEGHGYIVKDTDGHDIGYFGSDKYESIIFEARCPMISTE